MEGRHTAGQIRRRFHLPVSIRVPAALWLALLVGCGSDTTSLQPAQEPTPPRATISAVGFDALPTGLNDLGTVVGNIRRDLSAQSAFVFDRNGWQERSGFAARAVNNQGQLAGSIAGVVTVVRAEEVLTIGTMGSANGINERGDVVGEAATGTGSLVAFAWFGGAVVPLDGLGGNWSVAYDLDNLRRSVGWAEDTRGSIRPVLWSEDGSATELGTLGGNHGMAYAINDLGQVVGYAEDAQGTARAFRSGAQTGMVALPGLGGYSVAFGIDSKGRAVGECGVPGEGSHACLWDGESVTDLNDLLPAGSGWTLQRALAINSAGQIVGEGLLDGTPQAFLLELL